MENQEPSEQERNTFNANGAPLIKVIGVGGGGDNAVNHMYQQGIAGVSFVVTNTDRQALYSSPVPKKVLLGPTVTCGLGAGNVPERARQAAEESAEEIAELFDADTKMVFITAGMGGGTGTGAAPVVARIAKEKGVLTIGIVTIPFLFEGEKKIAKALAGADEMGKYVDAMLIINNERLTEIYGDLNLSNAFAKADDTLTRAAQSISEMINYVGSANLDFEDVNTTLRNGRTAIISTGYGEGEKRVTKAIEDALNSPLLRNRDIRSATRFLFNIYHSDNVEGELKMYELDEITNFMSKFANSFDVIWGHCVDNTLGEKVKITVLASGFDISLKKESGRNADKAGDSVDDDEEDKMDTASRIAIEYGEQKIAERGREKARANYILLMADQMDNDTLINFIAKNPTYRRGCDPVYQDEWRALVESADEAAKHDKVQRKTISFE